jgi:acyl-CoA thioesterase
MMPAYTYCHSIPAPGREVHFLRSLHGTTIIIYLANYDLVNMADIAQYFRDNDQFARHCDIVLEEAADGNSKARMEVGKHHLNGVGTVHGGALFTLADFAFAAACNSHGTVAVAINCSISYVKAVSTGTLTADARETSLGGRIATYAIDVTDEKGDLLAIFQGMAYRKKETVDDLLKMQMKK